MCSVFYSLMKTECAHSDVFIMMVVNAVGYLKTKLTAFFVW